MKKYMPKLQHDLSGHANRDELVAFAKKLSPGQAFHISGIPKPEIGLRRI